MLEKMREAAAAARLQAKADVVVDAQRGDRSRAIGRDDHAQAIFELGAFEGNMQFFQSLSFKIALFRCPFARPIRCRYLIRASVRSSGQLLRAAAICQDTYAESRERLIRLRDILAESGAKPPGAAR